MRAPLAKALLAGICLAAVPRAYAAGHNLTYHGGAVQPSQRVYTIFWNPTATPFPAAYRSTINAFVHDLKNSHYYGIASQYGDANGNIGNDLDFGGTWLDATNAIPHNPPTQADLADEVNRAIAANGWTTDGNSYFQVYLPSGYGTSANYCGYHAFDNGLAFGVILFPAAHDVGTCNPALGATPNGTVIDAAISVSAHEILEAATDPFGTGWWDPANGDEIADICNWSFGSRAADGSNLVIGGHAYLVQLQWSNADSACVLYRATDAPTLTSLTPAGGIAGTVVTISGTKFGALQGSSTVTFNGVAAGAPTWSDTSLVVLVPADATTGNVVVTVDGMPSNALPFTVTTNTPTIQALSPARGEPGTVVLITGSGFDFTNGTSSVRFNGVQTNAIVSWSPTGIMVLAPNSTTGNVVVTVGGIASNGVRFTYAPSLALIADRTTLERTQVALQLVGGSSIGAPFTYSATNLPQGLTLNQFNGLISGTLTYQSAGTYNVTASVTAAGETTSRTFTWTVLNRVPVNDFDGDGRSDYVVYRPSNGTWYVRPSFSLQPTKSFTVPGAVGGDVAVPGDYDGDGLTDVAMYRPTTGQWTIRSSVTGLTGIASLGGRGFAAAPGDYDGDGITDVAVFRPSTAQWTIRLSSTGTTATTTLGNPGDRAAQSDYDGDGKTDLATYSNVTHVWTIRSSSTGTTTTSAALSSGYTVAIPVPGDYDGDGRSDVAEYQPLAAQWLVRQSSDGATIATFVSTGIPVPGDYEGDGKTDRARFLSNGQWAIVFSLGGTGLTSWGLGTDVPVGQLPFQVAVASDLIRATDFDGDGLSDVVVYRKANSTWHILTSRSGYSASMTVTWGTIGDVPVAGDYDGDGVADAATYSPSTGVWSIRLSSTGEAQAVILGGKGDAPAPGDYDGDGRTDVAIFHTATAQWTILNSSTGATTVTVLGAPRADLAAPADYDGDGRTDLATYRRSTSLWTILRSSTGITTTLTHGETGPSIPAPADWDGDGKADPTVYGFHSPFQVLRSIDGIATIVTAPFALSCGMPVPAPGDYDGDGRADSGILGPSGCWGIGYSNNGSSVTRSWGTQGDIAVAELPTVVASPPVSNDVIRSSDFDGDGISDIFVYRGGTWHVLKSRFQFSGPLSSMAIMWGTSADIPVAGDYDGDGSADPAYFRPSTGEWAILQSSTGTGRTFTLGASGNLPVPGDYDGDGRTDAAVFDPLTGLWSIALSSNGATQTVTLGAAGDVPVPRDYDGDGKTDVAIYHAATGQWTIANSATNTTTTVVLGKPGDIPVPGDYDGDGKADVAVYQPAVAAWSNWSILRSTTNTVLVGGNGSTGTPVPADYDGDGQMDRSLIRGDGQWVTGLWTGNINYYSWGISSDVLAANLTLLNALVVMRPRTNLTEQTDFDADGKSDIIVFRPSAGTWHVLQSRLNFTTSNGISWGTSGDKPVPGDYDGDGKTDPAFFRPATGEWKIWLSSTNSSLTLAAGAATTDRPVPGDYDGDGKTDVAYYRPSTGEWKAMLSSSNFASTGVIAVLGGVNDIPVPGDYEGDGKTDPAVFHPATGQWQVLYSAYPFPYSSGITKNWGIATDIPVPADYDGDGKTDMAVYRPSTGSWYFLYSKSNFVASMSIPWTAGGSVQFVGDYDGDGKADLSLFAGGVWKILLSGVNYTTSLLIPWGISSDLPLPIKP